MKKIIPVLVVVAVFAIAFFAYQKLHAPSSPLEVACTMDAKICPDGSAVGRSGPNCEFAKCPEVVSPTPMPTPGAVPADIQAHIDSKAGLIKLTTPEPYAVISSPLKIIGTARGTWFFEASFPVSLTDWDGKIIAQGIATADGEWMTENFVPFTASLTFTKPVTDIRGTLILQKDNPSGLPEHDNALEIPVRFAEGDLEVI